GTEMYEHPQIGILLGARPQVSLLLFKGKLKSDLIYGGAIEGGYNASRFVGIGDEFWARFDTSYAVRSDDGSFVTIDGLPEAVFYLGSPVAAFVHSGFAVVSAIKQLNGAGGASNSISGATFGAVLGTGLDFALGADWNLRPAVAYRQGFKNAT